MNDEDKKAIDKEMQDVSEHWWVIEDYSDDETRSALSYFWTYKPEIFTGWIASLSDKSRSEIADIALNLGK